MSRSVKKKKIRKLNGHLKDLYHRIVRRATKNFLRSNDNLEEKVIPHEKEIVNDYDYIDYKSNCELNENCHCMRQYGRPKCINK